MANQSLEAKYKYIYIFVLQNLSQKWKIWFFVVAITIQAVLLIKCLLFILKQLAPRVFLPSGCPNQTFNASTGQEYLFTITIYGSLYIGRWFEAFIIHLHLYKFFFHQCTIQPEQFIQFCIEGLKNSTKSKVIFGSVAIYTLAHSLSIPSLGIGLEVERAHEIGCKKYIYGHHVLYWILDMVRYLHDVVIRLSLIALVGGVNHIWTNLKSTEDDAKATANASTTYENSRIEDDQEVSDSVEAPHEELRSQKDGDVHKADPTTSESVVHKQYLNDLDTVAKDHAVRTKLYNEKGKQVERVLDIFETWFVIPWVLYFISVSLQADHILQTWRNKSVGEGQYDLAEIAFLIYNFNQVFYLTLSYMCMRIVNSLHYHFVRESHHQQISQYETASKIALASMSKIEKEKHYDFVPRIWGSSIKIEMDSPLYVVFLLVGTFFTVMKDL